MRKKKFCQAKQYIRLKFDVTHYSQNAILIAKLAILIYIKITRIRYNLFENINFLSNIVNHVGF